MKKIVFIILGVLLIQAVHCQNKNNYIETIVEAPFPMEPLKEYIFPKKDFNVKNYGAIAGGKANNTEAIKKQSPPATMPGADV